MFGVPPGEIAALSAAIVAGGVVTGLLAGLFGVGGGAVIVPVLYEIFRALDVPEEVRMQLCVGTSLAIIVPMFAYMVSFMLTMPPATAGALTPFPQIAGSASSLLAFCQFLTASTAALIVGMTFDGTAKPMALAIAAASVAAFASFRLFRDK